MPDELTYPIDDGVNRVKRRRPVHFGFEPLPEAFDWVIFRRIRCQVFEAHPIVPCQEVLHGTALVHRGIIQDQDEQRRGKALVQLMQKLQKELGRASCGALPIETLSTQMQGAKQGGTLALGWGRDFDLGSLATPAALDIGFVRKMGFIDKEDFYWSLGLADADGGDNLCHPGFFFAALGALRGTVLAKRLYTQSPAFNWRRTVASLAGASCWAR
jgi:hypothetical protein